MKIIDDNTVREIKIIPYSHHDYAWVCTRNWHVNRYIKIYSELIEFLEENPDLIWCIDNVIHSWIPFQEYLPSRAKEFKKYVKEGRIIILNGGFSLARPSYIGEESYIRNMMVGRKYFKENFDIEYIPCLYNADTACGHSQLPQIAKLGGHKFYRFQRPDELLTQKRIPLQFIWHGLDGSEILVTRGFYGSMWTDNKFLDSDYDTKWEETKKEYIEKWLYEKLAVEMPTATVIQFLGSDDSRPLRDHADNPLRINEFIKEWNKREKVKMGFADFNKVCEELSQTQLPIYKGVLDHAELTFNFPIMRKIIRIGRNNGL